HLGSRTAALEDRGEPGDLVRTERAVAEATRELRTLVRGGESHRPRDEHRALALAHVVPRGLARHGGVAEHAEEIVTELEGLAEREADGAHRVELSGARTRERGTEHDRVLHRVARGLGPDDLPRARLVGGRIIAPRGRLGEN